MLALLMLPPVALVGYMTHLQRPGVLLGMIQQGLGPSFGGRVTMGKVAFEPPNTLSVRDLKVSLPPVLDTPFFQAPLLKLEPDLLDLIVLRPGLKALKIPDFQVRVIRRPDGSINLPGAAQLAALLEQPERRQLLTALSSPGADLSIQSFRVGGGSLLFDDQATKGQFSIETVTGQGRLEAGILRVSALEGQAFKAGTVSLGGRVRFKPPASAELNLGMKNLPVGRLAPWLLSPQARKQTNALKGDLSADATFTALSGTLKLNGHIQIPMLGFDDGAVTRARWEIQEFVGDLVASRESKGPPSLVCQFQGQSVRMTRGSSETALQFEGLRGELEWAEGSLILRQTEAQFGSGSMTAGGTFDREHHSLVVNGQNLELGPVLAAFGNPALTRSLDAPVLESGEARISAAGVEMSRCVIKTSRNTSFEGGCTFRPAAEGLRFQAATGQLNGTAPDLAEMTGLAERSSVEGSLSVDVTAAATGFTALVRAPELTLGLQPRLQIKGLAAAVSGIEAEVGGRKVSGWSANVRTSRFTVVWDALLQSLGFPENWPLAMNSGSATVVRDLQGLHVRGLHCQGARGEGSGEVHVSPEGHLSGKLQMLMSIKGSLVATAATRVLSGTLDEPVILSE